MTRRSISAAYAKPKTYSKRLKSIARSVRRKVNKRIKPKGLKPYSSLFPVK